MKNLYNITKGQLITLWVFGGLTLLFSFETYPFALILIPFVLIFYTIGWRSYRKQKIKVPEYRPGTEIWDEVMTRRGIKPKTGKELESEQRP